MTPTTASLSTLSTSAARRKTVFCFVLIAATLAVYSPALRNGFVNYDDPRYILDNSHIQSGLNWQSAGWAATAFYKSNWHPLTWISHAADISLFHLNPAGHHAINILLHGLNALILFLLLRNATGRDWESFFVAALFALHPVNVESVAWASERKNVLSMFFLLLAFYAYGKYAARPSIFRYSAVALFYALGLAAKPQIITLPFLLLLWDFWPLQRWNPATDSEPTAGRNSTFSFWRLCAEKIPLLLLSVASAVITIQAQTRGGAVQIATAARRTVAAYPMALRVENAVVAYARYVEMAVWPVGLAPMYPHPGATVSRISVLFSIFLLSVITAIVLVARSRRHLPVGWFWFLGSLVPMIGIVQVGGQAMADRYAYLPLVGLFCMLVWGISDSAKQNMVVRSSATAFAVVILAIFAGLTYRQIEFWRNSETLWNHTLEVTEHNFVAHDSLAEYQLKQGRLALACSHFQAAVNIFADDMPAQVGLAVCAQARNDDPEAIDRYDNVLRRAVEPSIRATAFANLGSIYRGLGDYRRAKENYDSALQINPDLPIALVGSGLLAQKGWDYALAAAQYAHAMRVEPTSVGYLLLAKALRQGGHPAEAAQAFARAQRLSDSLEDDQRTADALLGLGTQQDNDAVMLHALVLAAQAFP
ncbi:MAG TPA: tetratricopeptide repeat protein, partial [Candidatus Bathyarchaeia archaeon]|nr:tetratricopeptide repeat protein [Candidatus Bathyarchaeia archaeon]